MRRTLARTACERVGAGSGSRARQQRTQQSPACGQNGVLHASVPFRSHSHFHLTILPSFVTHSHAVGSSLTLSHSLSQHTLSHTHARALSLTLSHTRTCPVRRWRRPRWRALPTRGWTGSCAASAATTWRRCAAPTPATWAASTGRCCWRTGRRPWAQVRGARTHCVVARWVRPHRERASCAFKLAIREHRVSMRARAV